MGAVWKDSPGLVREDVEVQAVVPVGPPDERQPVRPEPVEREVDAPPEVVVERRLRALGVVPRHGLVEDREVAGLLDVGRDREHEPRRVVVEPGADVVVAALRERLVLVIGAAVGELRRGDVEDPRPGSLRDHVDEPEQVLVRVPEAHAPADARLEHGRRARQVERHHALVGVPGVDHPVDVRVAGRDLEAGEPLRPGRPDRREVRVGLPGRAGSGRSPPAPASCPAGPEPGGVELAVGRVLRVARGRR